MHNLVLLLWCICACVWLGGADAFAPFAAAPRASLSYYSNRFHQTRAGMTGTRSTFAERRIPYTLSTPVKAPPRRKTDVDQPSKPAAPKEKFIIKERRSIADEMEQYFKKDDYIIILYNDNFNKRAYVLDCLMEVFKWEQSRAEAVMMAAHTMGAVVAHECMKSQALHYTDKLVKLGLVAEARPANGGAGGGEDTGGGAGANPGAATAVHSPP